MKRTTIFIPEDDNRRAHICAAGLGITGAEFIRQAIDAYVRRATPATLAYLDNPRRDTEPLSQ